MLIKTTLSYNIFKKLIAIAKKIFTVKKASIVISNKKNMAFFTKKEGFKTVIKF